jgi:amidophosphoribosyltransferase
MGHDDDLMASRLALDEMRTLIGADTLGFLSLEGMMRAISDAAAPSGPDGFCNACFTGRYPIEVSLAQPKLGFEGVLA